MNILILNDMWVLIFMIISALSIAVAYTSATQTNYNCSRGEFIAVVIISLIPLLNIAMLIVGIMTAACRAEEYGVVKGTTLEIIINWLNKEL